MTPEEPSDRVERFGRVAFSALTTFGAAAVGYTAGGFVGHPLAGPALAVSYPLLEQRGRRREPE